ncbi:MAG: nitroreductase family protein [Pseudomonadota bacterium]|nr:nitroreductase family protein [Pseudomonadota bacterium]
MWDFFETVRHRHSVRSYQSDMPVEKEKLHAILETACSAPSAGDLQAYKIIVVSNPEKRQALANAAEGQSFISAAPVCLVFCADPQRSATQYGERGQKLYAVQDTTIAAAYAQLAVVAAGMGSTWVGYFDEEKVRTILQIDSNLNPIAMLSLGYPAELPEPTKRRRLDEIVSHIE